MMRQLIKFKEEFTIFCVFTAAFIFYFGFTAEDAFIVLRYVKNLLEGKELAFNTNERINALTSPFHALFVLPFNALFPFSVLQVYKVSALLLLLLSTWLLAKVYAFRKLETLFILLLVLLSPFVLMWTLGGLETPLLFFMMAVIVFYGRNPEQALYNIFKISLLTGLAFIIRFDSVLFTGPLLLTLYWKNFQVLRFKGILLSGLLAIILPLTWATFAYIYYHDFLPTSFYVKGNTGIYSLSIKDLVYPFQFFIFSGCLPLLLFLLYVNRRQGHFYFLLRRNLHFLTGLIIFSAYFFLNGTVHMMFGYRLIVPLLPVLLKVMIDFIPGNLAGRSQKAWYPLTIALFAFQCMHLVYVYKASVQGLNLLNVEYKNTGIIHYTGGFMAALRQNADDLQQHINFQSQGTPGHIPKFYTFAEGVIPYYNDKLYVYGVLVSYRHGDNTFDKNLFYFNPKLRAAADYLHVMTPWFGSVESQVGMENLGLFEVVSDREFYFDGRLQRSIIYYNPCPSSLILHKYSYADD